MLLRHILVYMHIMNTIYAIIRKSSTSDQYHLDCIQHKNIRCTDKVKFTIQYARSSKGAYLRINYTAFTKIFNLILIRKNIETIQVLRTNKPAQTVTVKDTYNGYLANTPSSYFYGTYSNGSVNGDLDDGDVTYHLSTDEEEEADDGSLTVLVDNVNHATYAYDSQEEERKLKRRHRRASRRKRSFDNQYPYRLCTLHMHVTLTYFEDVCGKSINTCVKRVLWYINFVDRYFRRIDFNFDGRINNFGFIMKYFSVLEPSRMDAEKDAKIVLHWFKSLPQPIVCQNVLLVNKVLQSGVLGLAYLKVHYKDTYESGGICYRKENDRRNNYNSLLVTERSTEGANAQRLTAITMMHELGHAFGAEHDQHKSCKNYRGFGNFVMYNTTVDLRNPNVLHFSVCSKIQIAIITSKRNICFVEHAGHASCGDYQVTGAEECDCGRDALLCQAFDKCCTPPVNGTGTCRINKGRGYVCSAKSSPCCNYNCQVRTEPWECRVGDECMESSRCNTHSYECPASIPRTDGTMCANGSRVCEHGKCTGSICRQRGWLDCFCNYEEKLMCTRCCRRDANSGCKPVHLLDPHDDLKIELFIQESDVCNYDKGYCVSSGKCQLFGYGSSYNDYQNVKHFINNYNMYIVYLILILGCIAVLIYSQVKQYYIYRHLL